MLTYIFNGFYNDKFYILMFVCMVKKYERDFKILWELDLSSF